MKIAKEANIRTVYSFNKAKYSEIYLAYSDSLSVEIE